MKRSKYSASAVKYGFWFLEFRKEIELLRSGKTFDEIKELSREKNIFGVSSASRAVTVNGEVTRRVKALGADYYDLFLSSEAATQKLFVLAGIMASDTLFFDLMFEVIREKMLIGSNSFSDADIRIFFHNKQVQDSCVAKWTEPTLKKLAVTYRTYLHESGMTDAGKVERKIVRPILDPAFEHWLKKHDLSVIVRTLTGEA